MFLLLAGFILHSPAAGAIEFIYKYRTGDKYRIISTVNQFIHVDRALSYRSEILNRIAVEIVEADGRADGGARLAATFQSSETTVPLERGGIDAQTNTFSWSRDYYSEFEQDRLGFMTVDDEYFIPMIRNVPAFPGMVLNPGDTWTAAGLEVHDFRDSFGIDEPYKIPFNALYTYLGERTWKENSYPAFSVSYRITLDPAPVPGRVFPRRIQISSDQVVFWDIDRGQPVAYEEHFRTIINLSDGQVWDYRGRADAEVVEAPPMDREEIARDIAEEIAALPDVSVRVSDEGVVINLENIQFAADSAVLRPSEIPKLDTIAGILMRYPDRDILVGGHTALAGTEAGRLQLSIERAQSVANYLLSKQVRSPDRVMIRGYGAQQPVADNRSEEGMRRNRRVEITILEN